MSEQKDPSNAGERPLSMKEKLMAQRRAQAADGSASTPTPAAPESSAAAKAQAAAAKPVSKPAAAPESKSAAPKPTASKPAAAPASKPAATRPASARTRAEKKEVSADVARTANIIREKENKVMRIVWIATGVVTLTAGAVLFNSISTNKAREEAAKAREKEIDDALALLKSNRDPLKEGDAKWILEEAEKVKANWDNTRVEGQVREIMRRAQNTIDQAKERGEMTDRMNTLEGQSNNPAALTLEQIKQARRTAQDLIEKSSLMGEEYKTRGEVSRDKLDRAYFDKLISEAKSKGQTREALSLLTLAEIEINTALNTASRGKNQDRKKSYEELFKQVIADSDTIAKVVFTQDAIDKEPWKDGLSGENEKKWQKPGVDGFQISGGELHAVGPKAGSGKNGIISIGDGEQLRDFVVEIEFVPVKGNFRFYHRLYQRADNSVPQFDVSTRGNDAPFKPGQSYRAVVSFVGSRYKVEMPETDITGLPDEDVSWTKQRYGAIGIEITDDSEIKIQKLRFKELRSNKRQ
ncbi:MAG: hypothetical protein RL277_611 [Planctomycetota bacterium]|jgi:hypothetical protein